MPAAAQPPCERTVGGDPPREVPWDLQRMNPESVRPLARGAGVTVAVLDSGVSATHPMLAGQVREGRDFGELADRSGQCDEFYHGTLVASVIAGRDDVEGVALRGMAPEATILPGRVLLDDNAGPDLPDILAEAITWAVEEGVDVINMSVESPPSDRLQQAIADALARDVVLVAAAGNYDEQAGQQAPGYPASYDGVIAVAGVDEDGGHVDSSQVAEFVDVAAPGTGIWGPAPGGGYHQAEGTSFATPFVSGVAALVRAYHPDLSATQVAERIIRTADRPPEARNDQVGHGVVNPYRAVTAVLGERPNLPAEAVALPPPEPDPLATPRRLATWAAVGGAVLAALLLLGPPAIRRGRQRGWRPARVP